MALGFLRPALLEQLQEDLVALLERLEHRLVPLLGLHLHRLDPAAQPFEPLLGGEPFARFEHLALELQVLDLAAQGLPNHRDLFLARGLDRVGVEHLLGFLERLHRLLVLVLERDEPPLEMRRDVLQVVLGIDPLRS
jgi:predicted component of type VI protein secretion system